MTVCTTPTDPEIADTAFCKALRRRVHDPNEALHIAATHHSRATEVRLRGPGWEIQAARHDQMAAICETYAAALVTATQAALLPVLHPGFQDADTPV